MAKVSVIIPTFNRPALLEEAVRSVLAQTCPDHEIIIVDDGSRAEWRSRIAKMEQLGGRISVYHCPSNRGPAATRNFGLEKASGDYILFVDDDDLIHPRMLESCLAVFERNPAADVVTCLSRAFIDRRLSEALSASHDRKEVSDLPEATYPLTHPDYADLKRITPSSLMYFTVVINSCLAKKQCIKNVRFPEDLTAGEDTYFWMTLASGGRNFVLNREPLAYVRFHDLSGRLQPGYDDSTIRFFEKLLHGGMLKKREDVFLAHVQLALKLFATKTPGIAGHLPFILKCPDLILRYFRSYYGKRARQMRRLYKFLEESRKSVIRSRREIQAMTDFEYEDRLKTG